MRLTTTHEKILVYLVSLHSFIVGMMLMFAADWALEFAGWGKADPVFFIWQAGAFHFVLASGYLLEYHRTGTVGLMVMAKTMAFVFLIGGSLLADTPWAVWFSGVADGSMALTAYVVHRIVSKEKLSNV